MPAHRLLLILAAVIFAAGLTVLGLTSLLGTGPGDLGKTLLMTVPALLILRLLTLRFK